MASLRHRFERSIFSRSVPERTKLASADDDVCGLSLKVVVSKVTRKGR